MSARSTPVRRGIATPGAASREALPPTAQRLLRAARRIVVTRGYATLTMQAVEKEAGVNRSLVHYYFGGKTGLVEALVDMLFEDEAFGYSAEVAAAGEGQQRVLALFAWLRRITADQQSGRLLYELLPHILRSKTLRARVAELYRAYRAFDGGCLSSGLEGIDPRAEAALGALSVAMVEGLGLQLAVDREGFALDDVFRLWSELLDVWGAAKGRGLDGPTRTGAAAPEHREDAAPQEQSIGEEVIR